MPIIWTVYLCEHGYKDPWLFFEAERGPQAKSVGSTGLTFK